MKANVEPQFGFWKDLSSPLYVLAPLSNVTDAAFRRVITSRGKPNVFWTEFVSADGLMHEDARERLLPDLWFSESERPIVAQIFGARPETMEGAARLIRDLGFDGVDINMGCPDRSVNKQGAGAALSETPELAKEVIYAAMRGAQELPVSVKIRLGYNSNQTEEWMPTLLETRPTLITVHGRTRKEMSKVPARWEDISRCVEIRDEWSDRYGVPTEQRTLIFGNGDVESIADAKNKVTEYGVDGVMLGKAIFGNPWLFNGGVELYALSEMERLNALCEHIQLFDELFLSKGIKRFAVMKKHFKSYVANFSNAKEITADLMEVETPNEALEIVDRERAKRNKHGAEFSQFV